MNNQHFFRTLTKVIIYNPKYGFIELFGHLYKTINSSAVSVSSLTSDIQERLSTKVIILNEQFINVVMFIYTK